jgi:hypothetical protein
MAKKTKQPPALALMAHNEISQMISAGVMNSTDYFPG